MELLKKKLLLVSVLLTALLISMTLLFLVLKKHRVIKQYQSKVSENREKIKKLIEDKDAPVKENLVNIEGDIVKIQRKVEEIHLIFGRPYRKAIQAFAEALSGLEPYKKAVQTFAEALGVDEISLYKKWDKLYAKEKKTSHPEQIFEKFLSEFDQEKVGKAKEAFKETFKKRSVEFFESIDEIIMEGLGLPISMTPEACKIYMARMEEALNGLLLSKEAGKGISITCDEKGIFQVCPQDKMPDPFFIPYIIKHYKLIEDFIFRLKECGVTNLKSLSKVSELDGTQDKGYLYLTYKAEIVGTQEAVRDLFNSLYNAYKDNRVYIIKNLKIEKAADEVKTLLEATVKIKTDSGDESAFKTALAIPAAKAEDSGLSQEEIKLLLGTATEVKAEIKFDYVVYLGDKVAGGK